MNASEKLLVKNCYFCHSWAVGDDCARTF